MNASFFWSIRASALKSSTISTILQSKPLHFLSAFIFFFAVFLRVSSASATSVAIVDTDNIIQNSRVMQYVQKRVASQQKKFQSQISKKEQKLKKEEDELLQKKSILSQEAFAKKSKVFNRNVVAFKKEVERKQESLQNASLRALSDITRKVKEIVSQIAAEQSHDIVLASANVLFFKNTTDISPEVLKRLNKEMPKLKVVFN